MKTVITSLVALLFFGLLSAQVTQIASGLNEPHRLIVYNNYVYFTDANSVQRVDYNNPTAPELVVNGLNNPSGIVLNGNDLYIADFNGGRIVKIDITQSNSTIENLITGLNTPNGIVISGNYLYYSDNNSDIIAKVDITSSNPTAEIVIQNVGRPAGIDIRGDFLYFAIPFTKRIQKIDITITNPTPTLVVGNIVYPLGIKFRGDGLYIANRNGNSIVRYNVVTDTRSDALTNLNQPLDVAMNSDTLFFVNSGDNSIYKAEGVLGLGQSDFATAIKLYPNPTQSFLRVTNLLEETPYTIYSISGAKVATGSCKLDVDISAEDLTSGIYLMKLNTGKILRFIKN